MNSFPRFASPVSYPEHVSDAFFSAKLEVLDMQRCIMMIISHPRSSSSRESNVAR